MRKASGFAGEYLNRNHRTTIRAEFTIPRWRCHHYPERAVFVGVYVWAHPLHTLAGSLIALGCDHGDPGTNQDLALGHLDSTYDGPAVGDRVAVTASVGPRGSRAAYVDLTTHHRRQLVGQDSGLPKWAAVGDWESVDLFPAGPPPDFDPLTFQGVAINGQPLAARRPTRFDSLVHGRVRIRTSRLRHRDSFTTRLVR